MMDVVKRKQGEGQFHRVGVFAILGNGTVLFVYILHSVDDGTTLYM